MYPDSDSDVVNSNTTLLDSPVIIYIFFCCSFFTAIDLQVGEQTFIQSPNYPSYYPRNADVGWLVKVPQAYQVILRFVDFKTEKKNDIVTVRDGWTSDFLRSTQRASLSGSSVQAAIISQGSYLWVNFTSDYWTRYRGFRARLSAELRTITLTTEGTEVLTSPNYPEVYENNIDTIWYVRAPAGYRVLLRFINFSTEESYDTVILCDGWTSNYSRSTWVASVFGQSIPENITSAGSHLWIQFTSNSMYVFTGFRALLYAVIPVINLQTNETQILTSPNFPSLYDNNIDIVWHVRAPSGYRIMVHFTEFNTEYDRDFVYVYDGKKSVYRSSDPRDTLSGRSLPRDITTVGAYLWIRFTSDNWYSYFYDFTGFKAMLTTVETPVIMLDTIETEYVSIPNVPGYYDNNIDIAFQVIATSGFRVHILFHRFETEENSDFVYIFEGWTSDFSRSTLRASLSGWSIPENITSIGSYLWIRFASNEGRRFKGFQALLNAKIPVIYLNHGNAEYLQSPNYPAQYGTNLNLMWHAIAPENHQVVVHFVDFSVETFRDFLYLYEGQTSVYEESTLRRPNISGTYSSHNITTLGPFLWIRFTSDDGLQGGYRYTGFNISLFSTPVPGQLRISQM
ncbi:CUB and sushi domain-containing protein 3-like [Strongylocentrotus purpuratus]|uniref:CUB domain-containing protein n=1 Tax=Strongylocentrotus purpuratus TaxID=7668 RepID=A0A7M7NPE9_STRPU|nr:CUB and sushi domain-containing protein 3-like [Strongylocentrotus purpuratus]